MKKFSVPCDFDGVKSPFTVYVGSVRADHHPLHFQADWLSKERGGTVPQEVMESLSKLQELAKKNNTSFEDLCVYALGAAQDDDEDEDVPSVPEENSDDAELDDSIEEEPEEGTEEEPEEGTEEEPEEQLKELEEETKNRDTEK
jgi:hypothetical protein